jgi:hypothetical protein
MLTTRHRGVRRGLAALAVATAAAALPAAASAAGSYGYVWADDATASSYIPDVTHQANSKGRPNTITRSGVGLYTVAFRGLRQASNAGTVHVTAFGSGGRSFCGVIDWVPSGTTILARVRCATTDGDLVDSQFDASYVAAPKKAGGAFGYVLANSPTNPSYTPAASFQFNSKGGTNTVGRASTGSYAVRFPGLGSAEAGTVKVTTYGASSSRCKLGGWAPDGADQIVAVGCFNSFGLPVDAAFTLTYAKNRGLTGLGQGYGYVLADQPDAASYTPDRAYAHTAPTGAINVTRLGLGAYSVTFSKVGSPVGGNVQVTSFGIGPAECRTDGWVSDGASGQTAFVECYDSSENLVNSAFTLQLTY